MDEYCKNHPDDPICRRMHFKSRTGVHGTKFQPPTRREEETQPVGTPSPTSHAAPPHNAPAAPPHNALIDFFDRQPPPHNALIDFFDRQPDPASHNALMEFYERRKGSSFLTPEEANRRKGSRTQLADGGPPPESLIIAAKEIKQKLKEMKVEGLSKIGLGNEIVKEDMRQHKYSRLSEVAYKYGYKDREGAKEIIKNGDYIPDFTDFEIIEPLSTKDRVVLRNSRTGEVVMSLRGSDTGFTDLETLIKDPTRLANVEDWGVNLHTLIGNPEKTKRYKDTTKAVVETARALGIEPREIHFTGHSNGGGNARRQAEIFGAEATTFNAADNPFKDMTNPSGVTDGGNVKAYRTVGDVVSAGHLRHRRTPEHMNVTNLTAKPGTETNLIEQHSNSQFFHDNPKINEFGEIEAVRTGKVKNFLGTVGGTVGQGALGLGLGEALEPHYADERIEAKEQSFLVADTAKAIAFEGALDPGATLLDLIDTMGMGLRPDELEHVRHALGVKTNSSSPPKSTPPEVITWLQKKTGRYAEDQELKADREMADAYGISYEEAYLITPETDPGVPIKNLDTKEVIQDRLDDASLKGGYDPNAAHAPRIYLDQPIPLNRPKELKDILETNPYIATRPKLGKKINGKSVYNIWQRQKDEWDEQTIKEYWRAQSQTKHEFEYNRSFLRKQRRDMYGTTTRRTNEYAPPAETPRRQGVVEEPPPQPPTTTRRRMGGEL